MHTNIADLAISHTVDKRKQIKSLADNADGLAETTGNAIAVLDVVRYIAQSLRALEDTRRM